MKKRWYKSSAGKGLLIFLTIITFTAACVSGEATAWLLRNGIWLGDNTNYVDSKSFADDIFMRSHEILNSIKGAEILEENSEDKVVDIGELTADDAGSDNSDSSENTASGITYKLGDLCKWSQGSWDTAENVLICQKPDGSNYYMYYKDFANQIKSGDLQFKVDEEFAENGGELEHENILANLSYRNYILDDYYGGNGIQEDGAESVTDKNNKVVYTNVWNYTSSGNSDEALVEEYAPEGADSILDLVNSGKYNGELGSAYRLLYKALLRCSNAIDAENILDSYKEGNTNLSYLLVDNVSHKLYSNIDGMKKSGYRTYLKKLISDSVPCMILYPDIQDCESSIFNTTDQSVQNWQKMVEDTVNVKSDYVFAVSVDPDFSVSDQLAASRSKHDKYYPWLIPCMAVTAGMLILSLFCLVVLTIGAGRNNKDREVHLNLLDRIYTEIAALGIFLTGGVGYALCTGQVGYSEQEIWNFFWIAMAGLWFTIWFLTGWLSLVRRIKAKSLWRDSLLRHLLIFCKKIFRWFGGLAEIFSQNLGSRIKMILLFGVFVLAEFILHGMGLAGGNPFALLFLLILDGVVLYALLKKAWGRELILSGLKKITDGELQYKIPEEKLTGEQQQIAGYINHIGEGLDAAVENSLKNERMKTELITNVSHDLKTPLTSIINYVDLLKRENPQDPKVQNYIAILEDKAQRLKTLTEDVVEASKASTGNISLEMTELNFVELIHQVVGEFEEKFQEKNLIMVVHFDQEEAMICADGRRLWRVLENIFGNVTKYAMENTRVYAEVNVVPPEVRFSLKNISAQPLNITAEELTERFVRGDVARNTEGSGLGLSIAQSLTELQGGEFKVYVDGDLFKVTIIFKMQ